MNNSKGLTISTIITHGLILILAGHGGAIFFLVEIFTFPYFTSDNLPFCINSSGSPLTTIGLTALLGQIALVTSIFNNRILARFSLQIVGLTLFWLGIFYFIYFTRNDNYTVFVTISCIPFIICTILMLGGKTLLKLYKRKLNKI